MKQNKKQICQSDLIHRILTLDIAPGAMLDETSLSQQYDLSRTPLREVIQRLSGEGYLTLEENRGATVSTMDLARMRHFFQAAPMIYASVARLAAENATPQQIEKLKNIQYGFRKACENEDGSEMAILNHQFHRQIGDMAASPYLSPSLNRLLIDHTRMSQSFYRPANLSERKQILVACEHHDQMIEAIEQHQPAIIVDLTIEHWALSRDQIERFVQPEALPIDIDFATSEDRKNAV